MDSTVALCRRSTQGYPWVPLRKVQRRVISEKVDNGTVTGRPKWGVGTTVNIRSIVTFCTLCTGTAQCYVLVQPFHPQEVQSPHSSLEMTFAKRRISRLPFEGYSYCTVPQNGTLIRIVDDVSDTVHVSTHRGGTVQGYTMYIFVNMSCNEGTNSRQKSFQVARSGQIIS